MNPCYQDNHRTLYNKDCRGMSELPDESVQCVVTSPPYWGLRKYVGVPDLIWAGETGCEHDWTIRRDKQVGVGGSDKQNSNKGAVCFESSSSTCQLCGAWKGSYGLEPTPELYVQHTIEILREIRRVLRKDGVVFWNIGDSYAGGGFGTSPGGNEVFANRYPKQAGNTGTADHETRKLLGSLKKNHPVIKPKDLCLIPFRIALAAQADGWWIRSDIIWNKPNPMPESVTDRPTNSYEHIFMMTKSARYYWDADAVREKAQDWGDRDRTNWSARVNANEYGQKPNMGGEKGNFAESGRNLRDVWTIATQPYADAHFATFPQAIPERCIKAATPEAGCCSKCGSPYERVVEKGNLINVSHCKTTPTGSQLGSKFEHSEYGWANKDNEFISGWQYENKTIGWQPTCKCNAEKTQSIVLDPFAGSGTTLWVAAKLNRKAVGYELSEKYCKLIEKRNHQQVLC